jgi:hypothetical protein
MLIYEQALARRHFRDGRFLAKRLRLSKAGLFGRVRYRDRRGAILVPDVGEVNLLDKMLGRVSSEDMLLGLFKSTNTPAEADTLGTYTACDFTNYVQKTLTKTSWGAAATSTGTTSSSYAQQSWTCGASGNTVYGALYIDTDTTTLIASDLFAVARVIANTDVLNFTPKWQLD